MRLILLLVLFATFCQAQAFTSINFNRQAFYNAMKSGNSKNIDEQLAVLQSSGIEDKEAFEGSLLMKKAGLAKSFREKLRLFKSGRIKLETAIQNNNTNVEYRFMRLMIQEHVPKQARYKDELIDDAAFIEKNFKSTSPELQEIIIDYSKQSKALKTASLQ